MGARHAPAPGGLPGRWGLTTAVSAPAGAAVAATAALLEEIASALADVWGEPVGPLGLGHACPACGGTDHGAPSLTGLPTGRCALVSFTHVAVPGAPGMRVRLGAWWAGAGRGAGLGLDLEREDAPAFATDAALGDVAFSPRERGWLADHDEVARPAARAVLWTRKEAVVKAAGTGFTGDPTDVPALRPPAGMRVVDLDDTVVPGAVGALAFRVRRGR